MDSAFRLFAYRGIVFTLSEVASQVGIQKASIYAHFPGKEALLFAAIERESKEFFLEINERCQDLESMYWMILNYYEKSQTKLLFWKRLLLLPPLGLEDGIQEYIKDLSGQRFELAKKIIVSGMEGGILKPMDPDAVAFSFFSMIHGVLSSRIIYKTEDLPRHYEGIWQIFWNGIAR